MTEQSRHKLANFSIVMPYFNEEQNIKCSLNGAVEYCRARFEDFEIVAVDDASTDRTVELARNIQKNEPRIKIVALEKNTRFVGALKRGYAEATKDYVFYTDGDCPIDYFDIDKAFEQLDYYDVLVGFRMTRDKEGLLRKLYTNGYRFVLLLLFGLRFKDVNFSFKLFPRKVIQAITIESTSSFIDAEILYKIKEAGYRIGEVPVHYHSRTKGKSTLASPMIIVRLVIEMLKFRFMRSNTITIRND